MSDETVLTFHADPTVIGGRVRADYAVIERTSNDFVPVRYVLSHCVTLLVPQSVRDRVMRIDFRQFTFMARRRPLEPYVADPRRPVAGVDEAAYGSSDCQ
jgi:hypothetical protein